MAYNKGSEASKFYNIAYTSQTSSVQHFIKNETGYFDKLVVNYISGSSTDNIVTIKDGYLSASISASIPQTPVLSYDARTVGTVHASPAAAGEEFLYGYVFNQGLVVEVSSSGSGDITIIYE